MLTKKKTERERERERAKQTQLKSLNPLSVIPEPPKSILENPVLVKETSFIYPIKDFNKELDNLHPFLTKYFSYIFPNCVLLREKFPIPNGGIVDALAFRSGGKGKWGNLVLAEYKWKKDKKKTKKDNPISEVRDYFLDLERDGGGREAWDEYENYLREKGQTDEEWKTAKKTKFWKDPILLCVANFGYFEKWTKSQEVLNDKRIILVEVQKYEDAKNYLLLMWVVLGDYEKLGMKKREQIIQIPKKEQENAVDISEFLENKDADKWAKKKIIKIDKKVSTYYKSIERKATQWEKYFSYYIKSKGVLRIYPQKNKRKFTIYLKNNRTTTNFDKQISTNDSGITGQFEKEIIIEKETEFKQFFENLKSYLSEIKKDLGV